MSESHKFQKSGPSSGALVSVIVMAYRHEVYVREAIEGALAQTYQPLEILLSDDASPDRTFEIMKEMAASYCGPHRVILNRNPENLGLIQHIDRIMKIVSGDFIVQSSGDDISHPQRVEALARVWRSSSRRVLLVYSKARRIDAGGRQIGVWRAQPLMLKAPNPENIIRGRLFALGATCGWDRRIFDVFGPLGPDLGVEDTILPLRAAILGEIGYVDEELVSHREGGLASVPDVPSAHDVLYGAMLRRVKWRLQNDRYVLNRFRDWQYPGKQGAEAACRLRMSRWEHQVALAETPRWRRPLVLPRAFHLAFKQRSLWPLVETFKYLFEEFYDIYWKVRSHRRTLLSGTGGSPKERKE